MFLRRAACQPRVPGCGPVNLCGCGGSGAVGFVSTALACLVGDPCLGCGGPGRRCIAPMPGEVLRGVPTVPDCSVAAALGRGAVGKWCFFMKVILTGVS